MPGDNKSTSGSSDITRSAGEKYAITIIKNRCKGCKLCITFCPSDTLEMSDEVNSKGYFVPRVNDITTCKGCDLCFKYCPDFAIYVEKSDNDS